MRDVLMSGGRRLRAGWFWPLVLLVFPNCVFQTGGIGPAPVFEQGSNPTSAIMCAIPKFVRGDDCATSTDVGIGMSLAHAAVALNQGENNSLALDFSPAAEAACGGLPKKIDFQGTFPDGYAACINCGTQIGGGKKYPDANAACVDQCIDLVNNTDIQPAGGAGGSAAFCQANAHVATNFAPTDCFPDACSTGGTLKMGFVDPRRAQEPMVWVQKFGAIDTGNTLTGGPVSAGLFTGGASKEAISTGDAWVEFEASENNRMHVVGLSPDPPQNPFDGSEFAITFGLELADDGNVYIMEAGNRQGGAISTYNPGDRFRVRADDNNDKTATIVYFKLDPMQPCVAGTTCAGTQIGSGVSGKPAYPLRAYASFGPSGNAATVANVTLVRIK
jgi:hypothetical protein